MPEGDTIFRAARTLHRALAGQTVTKFETQLPKLGRLDQDHPIAGRIVESVSATGKWMAMQFSGDLILLSHMLMSGSWHIYRPGEAWRRSRYHMRIVIQTAPIVAVAFNVPVAEFHTAATLQRREGFNRLGPDVLAGDFDRESALTNVRNHPDLELGAALLNQSILAGLGNVFKSEVCFLAHVNPFQTVGSLSPVQLDALLDIARKLMQANVSDSSGDRIVTYTGFRRTTGRMDANERLWVYHRAGDPCRRCGSIILTRKQEPGARSTFWCPVCQPL